MKNLPEAPQDSKYCHNCGKLVNRQAVMCPNCGVMLDEDSPEGVIADRPSGLAISSLITGILSFLCFFMPYLNGALAAAAIIMGAVDLKRIQNLVSSPKGRGLALAGLGCGAMVLVLVVALLIGGFFNDPVDYSSYL